ncbi:MAG TPA: hypothetical protein VGH15_08945 [Caulobacteraceae bacterium]|jgi:hypothetical protein
MTDPTTPAAVHIPPSESETGGGLFVEHPHHARTEERLAKLERRSEMMMLAVIIAFVVAIGIALLMYNTHVAW